MTYSTTADIGPYCAGADLVGEPKMHGRCRGSGPMWRPGISAPVLPETACSCTCHLTLSAIEER